MIPRTRRAQGRGARQWTGRARLWASPGGVISMVERAVIGGVQHGRGEARGVAGGGARR